MYQISSATEADLLKSLGTSEQGLDNATAASRLAKGGKRGTNSSLRLFYLLMGQFKSPLVLLLIVAVILSGILGETTDAIIIFSIVLATGLLGFFQEWNAGKAAEKLQAMLQTTTTVIRDGVNLQIPSSEVVAGDLILVKAGDIIPADCRVLQANGLQLNESSLTGESVPVEKAPGIVEDSQPLQKKSNCIWEGTSVISGSGKVLAVHTGSDSIFGDMQKSLSQETETAFEKDLKGFGYFLLQITLVLSIVILSVNLYFKKPLFDSILFSLAISIGMAPELLPAIMTLSMTAGAKRMLQKKVIVKKLSSIFNFGEVNVLCTDKTGTITNGQVVLDQITDPEGNANTDAERLAIINARLQSSFENPIDKAITARVINLDGVVKMAELPYDFYRKRLSILARDGSNCLLISKGAYLNIMEVCNQVMQHNIAVPLTEDLRREIDDRFRQLSEKGYRILGLSCKTMDTETLQIGDENQMVFRGFILLEDPLKPDAKDSVEKLKKLNTEVKIITGDNRYIAGFAARSLGLKNPLLLTGEEMKTLTFGDLVHRVNKTNVFAEIEPHQKESIILALKKAGNTVAYMGDGINDVAALHAADTGISVNDASDVAREAADFVLMEKDLSVLADGIYEGRRSFANSMKYILINTGATFGNMFSVAGASLLLPFLPMLPKQILLTNFMTDFPYLAVSSDNVDPEALIRPGKWNIKQIRRYMLFFGIHSSLFDFITFGTLYYYMGLSDAKFQTGWFLESIFSELLILFIIRTRRNFFRSKPGKILIYSTAAAIVATALLPISPFAPYLGLNVPDFKMAVSILIILTGYVLSADLLKVWFFRRLKNR